MEALNVSEFGATAPASDAQVQSIGREDFLKMLIAQLENQDPLNPQESTAFTAQLAQFSSLEQEIAMRTSLEQIATQLDRGDVGTAINLIGQNVMAESSHFELDSSEDATLRFDLSRAADSTKISIRDERGDLVAKLDLGAQGAGLGSVEWDGRNSAGRRLAPGIYTTEIDANFEIRSVEATSLVMGVVSGADISTSQPTLRIGEIIVSMSGLREVGSNLARVTP